FVPHDSANSNYRMARETLLDRVPIPTGNVHPWATDLPSPEDAALEMQAEIEQLFGCGAPGEGPPRFDVVLLGMGEDGHTASLFPNSATLEVDRRWAVPSLAPDEPRERVTFTLPLLNAARAVHFLVAGAGKRETLRCVLQERVHPERCPAALIAPTDGTLTWWLDEEVAPCEAERSSV
ncbi:MAG: 6-phosphogluconolactonase, partial [Armatimonadota bacterium]